MFRQSETSSFANIHFTRLTVTVVHFRSILSLYRACQIGGGGHGWLTVRVPRNKSSECVRGQTHTIHCPSEAMSFTALQANSNWNTWMWLSWALTCGLQGFGLTFTLQQIFGRCDWVTTLHLWQEQELVELNSWKRTWGPWTACRVSVLNATHSSSCSRMLWPPRNTIHSGQIKLCSLKLQFLCPAVARVHTYNMSVSCIKIGKM